MHVNRVNGLGGPTAFALASAIMACACIKQGKSTGGRPEYAQVSAPQTSSLAYGNATYGGVSGVSVIAAGGIRALTLHGDPAKVDITYVPIERQPFKEALRADVKAAPPNSWDLQLVVTNTTQVARGDVLLATFYVRTEMSRQESGEAETELVFELARPPWTKSASFSVRASDAWKQIRVPFVAAMTYPPGEAKVNFRLGFRPQIVDIGGLSVESFGRQLALSALPATRNAYGGMEQDAPWRTAAAERIDKFRKADFAVVVKDRAGQALVNAEVRLHQTRQAFGLGTCVAPAALDGPDGRRYKRVVTELFNIATLENNLKWVALSGDWGPSYTIDAARNAIAWLRQRGLDVRGHVLVWPGWRNLPRALRAHEQDPAYLRAATEQRIREVVSAVKGTVVHWDVVNEPFDNHDLIDILGAEVMVDWFKTARAVDPMPKLFINDFAILSGGGGDTPHRAHYEKTIKFLVDEKAPFEGIGLQGHFGSSLTAPEEMLVILDRFAKFKKVIWVTEYDVDIADEDLAGRFTRDFYTMMFSHPAVEGVVMWGFWDGSHWKNNAPLYRRDWSLKPAGEAFRELALKTWRTDAAGKTDAEGKFAKRSFLGDYEVEVAFAGRKKLMKTRLERGGATVTVVLD